MRTLADFRGWRVLAAKSGQPGMGKNHNGKSAKNLVVQVPVGTIIKDRETGELIADLTRPRQKAVVAKGGKGGRGNARFATSTDRAPRRFERGEKGETKAITLELRLLADVGLVGLPNAGKSTLIGAVSTARPKVADYPFTTLSPSVGVVRLGDFVSFTMADIPGLIEMAHKGKGLGHQFLRHIRRTSLICHLVEIPLYSDGMTERVEAMAGGYRTVRDELAAYDDELAGKPEVVCLTKADILPDDQLGELRSHWAEEFVRKTGCDCPVFVISAVRGDGLSALLGCLAERLGLDLSGRSWGEEPEYVDGEAPEGLAASELSMGRLDEHDEEA
jgi:GTP-binding protein